MSQSGYTPIQLYRTSTASAAPTSGNLSAGELAINLLDEKLYFKNSSGVVKLLASTTSATGSVSSVTGTGTANGLTLSGTVTSSGNITLSGNVTSLTTTNFTIQESGGKLVFKYGGTTIASMDSSGNFIALANVTAYGTP